MLKADFHIHTRYSMDSTTSLEQIIGRCQKLGLNCIAIADHGTIEGALKMVELAPFKVIVAEEILTPHGEIMGMFLKKGIASGHSIAETIAEIRAQDGLVCIPHPFDIFRGSALGAKIVESLVGQIDVIEIFNARNPLLKNSEDARDFAEKHGIPGSAGSDAHTQGEIGNAYVELPEFDGRKDFLAALAQGKITGQRTNPLIHFTSFWTKLKGH